MYVVGTSGHIDHGKTSLILALTGVDCDRLPEEKERQMTIDIGFASMALPGFGTVSFIDVPGHERFIRNMVAGAWGVDLGILVVAADDGWMPQTEDHFRVLQLLGIERIIAVINKTDMVEADMAELVEQQVREKIAGTPYADADIVRVSARTGDGIERLRDALAANLKKLSRARDANKPYLYIDRVFAAKGHGTVVTGTLRNGLLHDDDPVHIQPGNIEARVKRIESHHSELAEGSPSQRTALNLSGVPTEALRRGHILYRQGFFTESDEIVARIQLLDRTREMRNNAGIEVLIGTAALDGKLLLFPGDGPGTDLFPVRIKFSEPWHCYAGEPFVLTTPGGYRIIGGGMVLLPGYDHRAQKGRVLEGLGLFTSYTLEERIAFTVVARGSVRKGDLDSLYPESLKDIEAAVASLIKTGTFRTIGDYLMAAKRLNDAERAVLDTIKKNVGPNLKEVADATGADQEICRLIIAALAKSGRVTEKEGKFFEGGGVPAPDSLSKAKARLLETVRARGGEGMELDRIQNEQEKRDARELVKLGLLVSLDGNIMYHRDIYEDLKNRIMKLFDTRGKLTVPEAKDAAGLSRKYILPLLNRIERDGLIKRLGDFRIKA
ncbi:MAG: selenocysteine-specific translation elongation factor [Spirochaetes bacterium]|nr:selenocysteine-specific translation elongation factor [Spirochaetota bacterium]